MNLIPVWVLDGKHALRALDLRQRLAVVASALGGAVVVGSVASILYVAMAAFALGEASSSYQERKRGRAPVGDWTVLGLYVFLVVALGLVSHGARALGATAGG